MLDFNGAGSQGDFYFIDEPVNHQKRDSNLHACGPSSYRIEDLNAALPEIIDTVHGLKPKGGGEMAGPCPKCGGVDRFYLRKDGSWGCRKCGAKGGDKIDFHKWLNDTDVKGLINQHLGGNPKHDQKPKLPKAPATDENLKAAYLYKDENGAELFRVLRYEAQGHEKSFRQGHFNQAGQFVLNLKGVRRVLYRLPEAIDAENVVIVEGEKDVENLFTLGFIATCSPMGATNWKVEYAESLRGKHVAIIPDNDEAGRVYEQAILPSLVGVVAASVRVVRLPGEFKDVSEWIEAGGTQEELEKLIQEAAVIEAGTVLSVRDRLSMFTVKKDYVQMIGNEDWLFKNLAIKKQILVICAKSGAGKTTINFFFIAGYLIHELGLTVFYFDLDSPASDHNLMFQHAECLGQNFKWINPLTYGKEQSLIREFLDDFVKANERLDDVVFFFDTLKKFIDMLDKKSVKPFFSLLRQLTSLGATIILLGHANKHRGADGNLIFEGVGDIQSDTDALLFLERITNPDGSIDVTTVCDIDKGAKVRGLYEPITFHIARDRSVTLKKDVTPVPDFSQGNAKRDKLTDEEILEKIKDYLFYGGKPSSQSEIISALKSESDMKDIGVNKIREILNAYAIPERNAMKEGQIFYSGGGAYNKKMYSINIQS